MEKVVVFEVDQLGRALGLIDVHLATGFEVADLIAVDDQIDLEPVLADSVGLELPLHPVCREDCEGLCPECGVRLAIAESGHSHDILDPRWAGLAAKFGVDSEPSNKLVNNEAEEK